MVNSVIDDRTRKNDPLVLGIFGKKSPLLFSGVPKKRPGGVSSWGEAPTAFPAAAPQSISDIPGLTEDLIVETAKSCPKDGNGWILGAEFGTLLKARGYNPKELGTRVANIIYNFPDLFEVNTMGLFSFKFKAPVLETDPEADQMEPVPGGFSGTGFQPLMVAPRELTAEELSQKYTSSICTLNVELGFGYIRSGSRYSNPRWNNHYFYLADLNSDSGSSPERDMPVEFELTYDGFRSDKEGVPLYRAVNIRMLETELPVAI
jgi:hypothetical protein